MEAGCTVSGTATCAGLSVPNFMLRQDESSSYSGMLLLNTLQTPFPLRLLHPVLRPEHYPVLRPEHYPVLRPEHYSSIILFRWINSSASQATKNALPGTPRPPHDGIAKCDETLFLPMLTARRFRLKNLYLRTPSCSACCCRC